MIKHLSNYAGNRIAFVPTHKYTDAMGVAVVHKGESYLMGINFHNLSNEGDEVNFTFSGTYDFASYINSALIYLKAVSEIDAENQELYTKWIEELQDIMEEVMRVDTLLPAYEVIHGSSEE